MFVRARSLAPVCLIATLACRPEPATTPEPSPVADPSPDPGGPTLADEAEPEPAVEPEPEPIPEPAPDETAVTTDPASDPATTDAAAAAAVATTTVAEAEVKAPLPKPIFKAGGTSCVKKFEVGSKVKSFKLPNLAGGKDIAPSGYRNRVMLLNFWALWCKPCLEELPEFDRLYRKYRSHGMTLVAVTTDEEAGPVQEFVDKHKMSAKVALAGEAAASAYNRPQFPFSFVVDGDGNIVASFDYVDDGCLGELEQIIRDELEKLD